MGPGELPDLAQAPDLDEMRLCLALVEDEVERAGKRMQESERKRRLDHDAPALSHGVASRWITSRTTSKTIAISIARPPARMMLVLKVRSE